MDCNKCEGTGWVCENHLHERWEKESGETCCGAGVPCSCNSEAEYKYLYVFASTDESEETTRIH